MFCWIFSIFISGTTGKSNDKTRERGDCKMKLKSVKAVYYSATGNAKYIVNEIARCIAERLNIAFEIYDFTLQ